ncbi:MAG TPA: DMT family transporter [Myxococcota bacterium]|nr:DMT family transporter [Myxococcota bacterium]
MILLAIVEYAILASTFTLAKVAVGHADPLFLTGVRMVASAPVMFLVHYWQGESSFTIEREDLGRFFQASLFHIFLPFACEFWALQYVSSAKTAITYSLTPFIAAALSYVLLKKTLSVKQMLGLCVGLLGLMPIFFSGDEVSFDAGEFLHVSVPEVVLLLAVISASYAWFVVSDLMQRGYGISLINGIAMFFGGIFSLVAWYFISGDQMPIKGSVASFLFWTAVLIVVANVISFNLYGWLLRHLSITFMSALGFLCPIFASLYGVVLLKENLGPSHVIALLMVVFGLWLFYRDEWEKGLNTL